MVKKYACPILLMIILMAAACGASDAENNDARISIKTIPEASSQTTTATILPTLSTPTITTRNITYPASTQTTTIILPPFKTPTITTRNVTLPNSAQTATGNINDLGWLEAKIAFLSRQSKKNPPVEIWKCLYKSDIVYYFTPYCCDIMGMLYDQDGVFICSPDGGITGAGDGKCPDYFASRSDCTLYWKDGR